MNKTEIKQKIIDVLSREPEVLRIVIFGSFNHSASPVDIDIAVFQNSKENYLTLALKYRKLLRSIAKEIPIDILPLIHGISDDPFLEVVEEGEQIYLRDST